VTVRQIEHEIITNLKVATVRVSHVPQGEISLSVSILINLHQTSDTWEKQETECVCYRADCNKSTSVD